MSDLASKVIQDPVHGAVGIDGVYLEILDRPEMQRLRRVKQLGMGCIVFPGANHTRFEHCLGTYCLAGRMAEAIGLDDEDSRTVRMAALLHDVCHPPYSHALEGAMEDATGMGHMDMARALVFGKVPYFREEDSDLFGGMDTMAEVISAEGISPEDVCDLIAYPESTGSEMMDRYWDGHGYFPSKDYAHQIIHGPVDADQMDYLMRDSLHTGVCHGRIDCDRLIKTMSVVNDRIVLERGGVTAAEGLMVSRSLMYTAVYYHETTRMAQRMISKAVEASGIDASGIHTMGDSDLESMLMASGGRAAFDARRARSRMLNKKAFAIYSEQMDDSIAETLLGYTGKGGDSRLEAEIADAAGLEWMDVCAEVTSRSNLQGKMNVGKTDVSIVDDRGKVRSLARYSPIARALQSRDPYGWAVLISCPEEHVPAVSKASRRVLGLRSALYHADGGELGHLLGQSRIAYDADHLVHILVGFRSLLEHSLDRSVPEIDALVGHLPHHAVDCERVYGRFPGHLPSGPVAGRPERLLHAASASCEDIGSDAHVPGDYDGLPVVAVLHRYLGPAGSECARGALPVNEDVLRVPIDVVPLHLRDVVRHVVDDLHAHRFRGVSEDVLERFPDPMGYHLPVGPCVVCAAAHGAVVVLAELRVERGACQLPVREPDGVLLDVALHLLKVVRGYLVPASAGSAVDRDGDLPLLQPEGLGGLLVEGAVDDIQLQEVVPGSQGSQLGKSSLAGFVAHLGRIGIEHVPVLLGGIEVLLPSVSVLDGPFRSVGQDVLELLVSDFREPFGSESGGNVLVELVDEGVLPVSQVLDSEIRLYQTDTAVDVEADPSRGYGSGRRIDGGHSAYRESVAPVDIRHGHRASYDPGEACDVGGLLRGVVGAYMGDHGFVGVDDGVGPHADGFVHGDLPSVVVDSVELSLVCHDVSSKGL